MQDYWSYPSSNQSNYSAEVIFSQVSQLHCVKLRADTNYNTISLTFVSISVLYNAGFTI